MTHRLALAPALLLTFVLGCNPKGTCVWIAAHEDEGNLSQCIINEPKRVCEGIPSHPPFYEESPEEGARRCRAEGFEAASSDSEIKRQLSEGQSVMFVRTRKPASK